jgi:hypothetical protein
VVPKGFDGEIGSALEVLKMKNVNQRSFEAEVAAIFDDQKILDEEKEKVSKESELRGELRGELKGLMRNFIKSNEIDDDVVEGIGAHSLSESFVRQVWDELNNANKTKEKCGEFIQNLKDKGLMAE